MSAPSILFVDDEPLMLRGIRNLLWKRREEWVMVFAESGVKALEELQLRPFDLVVSDMRMPGMDGAELLSRISASHPETLRMVLTGYADRDAMLTVVPVAHQYLSKPCEGATLRGAIERALSLRTSLMDDALRGIMGKMTKLPSLPKTYCELCARLENPECGIDDLSDVIEQDPAMAIRVLQLVNSACFGAQSEVTSIREAVRFLGADLLKGLALVGNILSALQERPAKDLSLDQLQANWIRSAKLAKKFLAGTDHAETAYTATLIRDIGRMVLASELPDKHDEVVCQMKANGWPAHLAEKNVLGTSHAEIGAYILSMWGLPMPIVECVAFHHAPHESPCQPNETRAAVHVAGAFYDALDLSEPVTDPAKFLDMTFLTHAGLNLDLKRWLAIAEEEKSWIG